MAAASTPSAIRTVVSDAPTGTWRHPRLDEINSRLSDSTFGERNIKRVMWNVAILFVAIFLPNIPLGGFQSVYTIVLLRFLPLIGFSPVIDDFLRAVSPYARYALLLLRTIPLCGIAYACTPLLRRKDDLADIPLTPSQRALLGLNPNARPASPGSTYITPPRYAKSSPRSDRSQSGSPFSPRDSSFGSPMAGMPQSPSASPLFHKTVGREAGRRLSFGADSQLGMSRSFGDSVNSFLPSTPSPSNGRGTSVGLNNRWLYEKGRQNPGVRNMY